ncbi:MAG TPA: hypothetical protein VJS14_08140 [Enterobacteriaceae bacterium]|nr:hypothetical protein [Enterobacteriaceae bacterium]
MTKALSPRPKDHSRAGKRNGGQMSCRFLTREICMKRGYSLSVALLFLLFVNRGWAEEGGIAPNVIEQSDGIICHAGSNEAEVVFDTGFIVTCFYPDNDLLTTYKKYREKYKEDSILKLLKEDISPGKNARVEIAADFIYTYKWSSEHKLEVEIFQPGGVTTLEFQQKMSGTTVKDISSPD